MNRCRGNVNVSTPTFLVEVITLPVSNVERAVRFYVDQVGFTLDLDYSPNDAFRVVRLTPQGSSCSIQIGNGLTKAPVGYSVTSISSSRISRPCAADCSIVGSTSERSGTRRPLEHGMEVSHPGSTPPEETRPASPTSPIRMATAGCYRNGATTMCDVV